MSNFENDLKLNENKKLKEKNSNLEKEIEILNKEIQKLKEKITELTEKIKIIQKENEKLKNIKKIKNINKKFEFKYDFFSNSLDINEIKLSLQEDLIDYQQFTKNNNKLNPNVIKEITDFLQDCVDQCHPNYKVKLYGSRATNLCLMWSDLDYVIVHENNNNNINNEINSYKFLELLNEKISKQNWVYKIKFISSAKIPIIKVVTTEKYNKIPIDISMENSSHFGLKSVELVKEYLNKYESLEPIVFAIKTLLKLSNLNDPYSGGISSYGIVLMIVNFLINQNNKGEKISIDNIGSLFYEFLFYYGSRIDTNFINVTSEEFHFGIENLSPFQLYIVDPLNLNNNVGKSTFHYFSIKTMFLLALQSLKEECFCECHYNINSNNNNNKIENYYNHNCLKKMFNAVRRIPINYNIGF